MTALWVLVGAVLVVFELILWLLARRNGYGKTANGAFYAQNLGVLTIALVPNDTAVLWGLILAIAATLVLLAMALDKGHLL